MKRVRVQALGDDGQWWTVGAVTADGYVTLSRVPTVGENLTDKRYEDLISGVPRETFQKRMGIDPAEFESLVTERTAAA